MSEWSLGINLGFAVNRFPEPEVWTQIVGERLGLRKVQFVADLFNPHLPNEVLVEQIRRTVSAARARNISIDTTFTAAFTRVNHLLHPDRSMRDHWESWFTRFVTLSAQLGARGSGSHFGIFSVCEFENISMRRARFDEAVERWGRISRHAKEVGLQFLLIEPMSIGREVGETLDEAARVLTALNQAADVPFRFCLDVDHGNRASGRREDADPYVWLRRFATVSPVIHIKQSRPDTYGHWPFTPESNRVGLIEPGRVLEALEAGGSDEAVLTLEVAHKERADLEARVLPDLDASVAYWRAHVGG